MLSRIAIFAVTVLLLAGCSTPPPEYRQWVQPTPAMKQRADALSGIWQKDSVRAVLLREADIAATPENREALAVQLQTLHVNYCYLAVETMDILTSDRELLTDMVKVLNRRGIRSDLVLVPYLFPVRRPESFFSRLAGLDAPFEKVWEKALDLNRRMPEDCRIAGVTLWSNLHRLTASSEALPPGMLYRWSETDYGTGSDNDHMMKEFLKQLALRQQAARKAGLTFTAAIPAFYHTRAAAGDLTCGKAADFLKVTDRLLILGYGNRPSAYRQSLAVPLEGTTRGRILCGMVLSDHLSASAGAIRRRNWADFVKVLTYMHTELGGKPGCGGMVLLPYQSIALLLEK